jgi:hypothetical protein
MNKQEEKYLLYGLGILAVYILILRPIFIKLGLQKDPEREQTEERKTSQLQQQINDILKTQKPTKSVQEWQVIADAIYQDLRYSALSDNKSDAGYQVARVKNEADFWTLYKLFAKRREYLFGIPNGELMDLQQFIKSNLSNDQIEKINQNYKNKGIKFQF